MNPDSRASHLLKPAYEEYEWKMVLNKFEHKF